MSGKSVNRGGWWQTTTALLIVSGDIEEGEELFPKSRPEVTSVRTFGPKTRPGSQPKAVPFRSDIRVSASLGEISTHNDQSTYGTRPHIDILIKRNGAKFGHASSAILGNTRHWQPWVKCPARDDFQPEMTFNDHLHTQS